MKLEDDLLLGICKILPVARMRKLFWLNFEIDCYVRDMEVGGEILAESCREPWRRKVVDTGRVHHHHHHHQ